MVSPSCGTVVPQIFVVADLGIETVPTAGSTVVMDGQIIRDDLDLARVAGPATRAAVESFREISAQAVSIDEWRGRLAAEFAEDPAAALTGTDLLEIIDDDFARRYLKLLAHSDVAAEPHQTSARYALRKMVMGLPGYGSVYMLRGGMEELPRRLARQLTRTGVELNARVTRIESHVGQGYSLTIRRKGGRSSVEPADIVVLAVPHGALYAIESAGDALRRNVAAHIAAYDRPGHYLRVSLLFDRIFWRAELAGAWFMLDAFGGCCVYDESARHGEEAGGVLGWLIAGANALMLCNTDDETLAELALNTSPRTAPAIATIRLSAKSKRASRPREPPSAILTVSSRRLARARATSRLAMFVQATSRRSATAAIIAINGRSKAERSEDLPVPASVRVKGRVR